LLSEVQAYGATCAVLLITNQMRKLENCATLCALSSMAMVVAIALCMSEVLRSGCSAGSASSSAPALDVWSGFGAISTYMLAFAGQNIFLEIMSEMREPTKFSWALNLAMPTLCAIYAGVAVTTFVACGENTPSYLMDAVEDGVVKRIIGTLVFLHTIVSYTINQQVLARGMHLLVAPVHATMASGAEGICLCRLQWFLITSCELLLAFSLAVGIKTFEDIVHLIGALFVCPLCIILPAACLFGKPRHLADFGSCTLEHPLAALLLLLAAVLTVLGTYSALLPILGSSQ